MRSVPPHILRPDYAETGRPVKTSESLVKGPALLAAMRHAGRVAAEVLATTGDSVRPGVTTDALDAIAHDVCIQRDAYPSPLNYHGFPKSVCTSVNEVICHGIPDNRPLGDGDIVNIDVTVYLNGVHGDTNATYLVGDVDPESQRLVEVTRECLELGIGAVRPGRPVSDIGKAIDDHASAAGFGLVRTYVGHGIGEVFHNGLAIPHYFDPRASSEMEEGMTFTIEPMLTMGTGRDALMEDGWTAVTADRSRSAQFEHTLAVTGNDAEVLTRG
jgi:methionyl aminopeptidase